MLLITGTQRSGTSFVTNFFKQSGYDVGSDFWHEDINGGLEHLQICSFFRRYLGDPDFPFSDLPFGFDPNLDERNITHIPEKVGKFSFLMMLPILPYIWHKFRGTQDAFLILTRPLDHIVQSKKRVTRFGTDSILLDQAPAYLGYNFNLSLRIIVKLGITYRIMEFPKLLKDFKTFSQTILELGLDIRNKKDVWDSLVDFKKVHFE